jgi:hypothetical protein
LCAASAIQTPFTVTGNSYGVSQVGTVDEICYETKSAVTHFNCNNLTGRSLSVNGGTGHTTDCNGNNLSLPAARNGGFCFQFTAGQPPYAAFSVFF